MNEYNESQLIEILDKLSLCSTRCTIPKGKITDFSQLYVLVMFIRNNTYIIARNKPSQDGKMYFIEECADYETTVEEVSEKLKSLAPVYKELADISRRHKVFLEANDFNKSLLCKLEKKNYITSFFEEPYTIDDHTTHKKQELKRFGVWVKQKQ